MRPISLILAAGFAGSLAAAEAAPRAPQPQPPATIGLFAVQVSAALGREEPTAEAAAGSLRALGIHFGADLAAPLTEGMAARVMRDLGHAVVQPVDPTTPISEAKAGILAGTIASLSLPLAFEPERTGPAPSAGLPSLLQCLQSPNSGLCTQCCIGLLPPNFPNGPGTRLCNRLCAFNTPPPSPMSPG